KALERALVKASVRAGARVAASVAPHEKPATVTGVPAGVMQQVKYTFTDLFKFLPIAELPVKGLTFSKVLNGVGPWAGTLPVEDRNVRRSDWITATSVWRSALWVDINGSLLYGGPTTSRVYDEAAGTVSLAGNDFCFYLSQRLQAKDYSKYKDPSGYFWAEKAPVLSMAYYILQQAMEVTGSIPIQVVQSGATPAFEYWVAFSAPGSQYQTVASLLGQLQELGYLIGVDYTCRVHYENGKRATHIELAYPRLGNTSGQPTVIELVNGLGLKWPEDGSQMANKIVELAGSTTDRSSTKLFEEALAAGYPLMEATVSHPSLAPSEVPSSGILEAYLSGALWLKAYPQVAPQITLPMFGSPSIFELNVGDNV